MQPAQLDLFATGTACHVCGKDPGRKPEKPHLWHGFRDMDTRQYCCWDCRQDHYRRKFTNTKLRGLYSEMPVMIKQTI